VDLLLCAPFGLLYLFTYEVLIDNVYLEMILKYLLPLTATGFFLFGVSDWIHLRLGLYDAKKDQGEMIGGSDQEN